MTLVRTRARWLAALTLGIGVTAASAAPPPQAEQMLVPQLQPKQPNIDISTPSPAEYAKCTVELIKGNKLANGKTPSGWLLKDSNGRPLRRFFDSDGDGQLDVWSFYRNGEECYREIDSNFNQKPDQFRWLGANGSKWGVDLDEDGRIDTWKAITPEEVSQELLAAVQTRDTKRLQALMITKAELDAMELPEAELNRIKAKLNGAGAKFQTTAAALIKLSDKTKWVLLESGIAQCIPADTLGSKYDLVRFKNAVIHYSEGEKHDYLQTGELIMVGRAWRIIDAPSVGNGGESNAASDSVGIFLDDSIKELVEKLKAVDDKYKGATDVAKVVEYNVDRAKVLEEIVTTLVKNKKPAEDWMKQVADCYSTAAQNGDKPSLDVLAKYKLDLEKSAPGSNVTAYFVYREMTSSYARLIGEARSTEMTKLQEEWKDRLSKFVQAYATAEDTPEALMQLGMVNEFMGKETEARNWYAQLANNFKSNPLAKKADGAIRRLTLEGKELDLNIATLGSKAPYDLKSTRGKVTVVYYWASWNGQCAADFAKLKLLKSTYGAKLELVCVNLDTSDVAAIKYLQQTPVDGTHLYEAGGLDSPAAVQYGVMVLPNLFLVGADGKVLNRNLQVATLDDELKKLTK